MVGSGRQRYGIDGSKLDAYQQMFQCASILFSQEIVSDLTPSVALKISASVQGTASVLGVLKPYQTMPVAKMASRAIQVVFQGRCCGPTVEFITNAIGARIRTYNKRKKEAQQADLLIR